MRTPRFSPRSARGFTLIEVMIVVAIIGILSAIAIPNFVKFQARSKQSEVKANLKSIFTAQRAYFAEKNRYSDLATEIGFSPERGNRYSYVVGTTGGAEERNLEAVSRTSDDVSIIQSDYFRHQPVANSNTVEVGTYTPEAAEGGITPTTDFGVNGGDCPTCTFFAGGVGNIDNDVAYDSWVISGMDGTGGATPCSAEENVNSGSPYNTHNDVSCEAAP